MPVSTVGVLPSDVAVRLVEQSGLKPKNADELYRAAWPKRRGWH